jgi:hypothetical protein
MTHPHIYVALARERQNTLLAEAQADHRSRQARSHRRRSTMTIRRSPFRWKRNRLASPWRHLLTRGSGSASAATGGRAAA